MKFSVVGTVTGTKYLGTFEAPDAETAVEMALDSEAAHVHLCHQCDEECGYLGIETAIAAEAQP